MVQINPIKLSSLEAFFNRNGCAGSRKEEVYFIRYIGMEDERKYRKTIQEMDRRMNEQRETDYIGYIRVEHLDGKLDADEIIRYAQIYEDWKKYGENIQHINLKFSFPIGWEKNKVNDTITHILKLFQSTDKHVNESITKNFFVKLMHWLDIYLPELFLEKTESFMPPKFIYYGDIKRQEYIFLYCLVLLGCDVLYLHPEKDCSFDDTLLTLSYGYKAKYLKKLSIAQYNKQEKRNVSETRNTQMVHSNVMRAEDVEAASAGQGQTVIRMDKTKFIRENSKNRINQKVYQRRILEYVELAKIASSVVMISVYDKKHTCFKTGSGVMVGEKGYILTNFHVIYEGAAYGIRLEEEETLYETDELIKYNQLYDLAVLRIDRKCMPIPIYQEKEELVRGEKVVAIGSPLGLFNSVSDGIISGFRKINDTSMLQFTAPTSHGSSGGALLNLYGELIGIITAGFDDGQNINLAVDYKTVFDFVRGFL